MKLEKPSNVLRPGDTRGPSWLEIDQCKTQGEEEVDCENCIVHCVRILAHNSYVFGDF